MLMQVVVIVDGATGVCLSKMSLDSLFIMIHIRFIFINCSHSLSFNIHYIQKIIILCKLFLYSSLCCGLSSRNINVENKLR